MAGGEDKISCMVPPSVKLHVACRRIADHTVPCIIFHPALAAVVDGEDLPVRYKAAVIVLHMKIIEAEHYAGKYRIDSHGPFTGLIVKLPD